MIQPEEQSMAASVRHLTEDTTGGFEPFADFRAEHKAYYPRCLPANFSQKVRGEELNGSIAELA